MPHIEEPGDLPASRTPFEAEVTLEGDFTVVTCAGEIDLDSSGRLREVLDDAASAAGSTVVVDFRAVEFLDSTGLGVLISAYKRLRDSRRDLVLRSPSERVLRVLEIAGVDGVLKVVDQGSG